MSPTQSQVLNPYAAPASAVVPCSPTGTLPARPGARIAARSIDLAALVGPAVAGLWAEDGTGLWAAGGLLLGNAALILHLFLVRHDASGIGKHALGLRVVCADGSRASSWRLWGRGLLRLVLTVGGTVLLLGIPLVPLGNALCLLRQDRRTLHDRICGTQVVSAPRAPGTALWSSPTAAREVLRGVSAARWRWATAHPDEPVRLACRVGVPRSGVGLPWASGCTLLVTSRRIVLGDREILAENVRRAVLYSYRHLGAERTTLIVETLEGTTSIMGGVSAGLREALPFSCALEPARLRITWKTVLLNVLILLPVVWILFDWFVRGE